MKWCRPVGRRIFSKNAYNPTPATPLDLNTSCNKKIASCTLGHTNVNINANGIIIKNPIITTKLDPENIPNHSGNSLSKYLLCIQTTIPAIIRAPIIPVSNVLIPHTFANPLVPPISAAKFTPKLSPQNPKIDDRK